MKNPVNMIDELPPNIRAVILAFYKANWYYLEGIPFFQGEQMNLAELELDRCIADITGRPARSAVIIKGK